MNKEEIIDEIIRHEWKMFQQVRNEGGRADCQDEPEMFRLMRRCQFSCWDTDTLCSYQEDLMQADWLGRNLLTEKYANMMASTAPEQYRKLEPNLPYIPEKCRKLTEEIVAIHKTWMREHADNYPQLTAKGRPMYTEQDSEWETSSETYLRGELLTYSVSTLTLLLTHTKECRRNGINLVTESDRMLTKAYGYRDLDAAECAQRG